MSDAFRDKVALVTGAASGIGRALAFALAQRGVAVVVLADLDAAGAQQAAGELTEGRAGRAEPVELDVRDDARFAAVVDDVVARHGRIDLLFNNAGVAAGGDTEDLTLEHWDRIIDVNIRGVVHGVRAAYPHMLRQHDGHIVNTASLAGIGPSPLLVPYAMSKHAVVGLSTSLRVEAADRGVRVSALCPAGVDTPILERSGPADLPQSAFDPRRYLRSRLGKEVPVQRAVEHALRGVARNRPLIFVPKRAGAAWRLERLLPGVVARATRTAVRKERRAVQAAETGG